MSHPSSDSSNQQPDPNGKGIPLPRSRRIELDEEELWNLEDDMSPPPIAKPVRVETPGFTIPPKQSSDIITRIEPSRQRALMDHPDDEMDPWSDEIPEKESSEFIPLLADVPEPVSPKRSTTSSFPIGMSRTEDEIWGDFVDDQDHDETDLAPTSSTISAQVESPSTSSIMENREPSAESMKLLSPTPTIPTDEANPSSSTDQVQSLSESVGLTPPLTNPDCSPEKPSWKWPQFSQIERISLICSFVVLGLIALVSIFLFQRNIHSQENPYIKPDMPCLGNIARIDNYATYWRAPIREGIHADPTRLEVISIPVIELTLGSCSEPSGVIRVVFYNERGEIAGDTQSQSFTSQVFRKNGQPTLSFAATTGFTSFGEQEAYRARQTKPWVVRVYEAKNENAPSSSYRLLFSTAVSTKRQ